MNQDMSRERAAVVTGAAGGVGRPLVAGLLQRGWKVLACDTEAPPSDRWQSSGDGQLRTTALDVRDKAGWEGALRLAVEAFGGFDTLIQLAGVQRAEATASLSDDAVDLHIDVNLKGSIQGCRVVLPYLLERGEGHIVNVGSLASISPVPGLSLYCASKHGLRGFTHSMAHELAGTAVDVTLVCPDTIDTQMTRDQLGRESAALIFSGRRLLDADDVARVILDDALERRPLEILIPSGRGLLAKLAAFSPGIARRLAPAFLRKGAHKQRLLRGNLP